MTVFALTFVGYVLCLTGIALACRNAEDAARVLDESDVSDLYEGPR